MTHQRTSVSLGKLAILIWITLVAALILLPLFGAPRSRPWFDGDLSNLSAIAFAVENYKYDHDGMLPEHVMLIKDTQSVGDWEFVSRHDPDGHKKPVANDHSPNEWYKYGSYMFYPTKNLSYDSISDPSKFVLTYCPPFKEGIDGNDHPVVFLDGSVEMLNKDDLARLINSQQLELRKQFTN